MVYLGIMGMTRAVWVGQVRVWVGRGVGHGLRGQIARTASACSNAECQETELRGGSAVGRWTCDLQVAGSIPSRSAFT